MDSESPLPAKRLRGSLNGNNLQLTECIREFKLPRQYPSMATKLSADMSNDKRLRPNYQASVGILQKACYTTKIVQNKDIVATNPLRKIKLKGKDGRDLGEVSVQDLPQNIQGKTICLSKNGIKTQSEVPPTMDKSKGITIGVLTPVNILKANGPVICSTDKKTTTMSCIGKTVNSQSSNVGQDKDPKKMLVEQKKMSAVMDPQGRPQVLVFQSGKKWHMVKIASNAPPTVVQASQGKKNIVVGKWPQALPCAKVSVPAASNQDSPIVESARSGEDVSSTIANKICTSNQTSKTVRRWSLSKTPDSTTDRCKSKSPTVTESVETSRPKIVVSRVFGPASGKQSSVVATKSPVENGKNAAASGDTLVQKSSNLRQDVMVVVPGDSPVSLDNETSNGSTEVCEKTANTSSNTGSAWRRKLLANKNGEGAKYSATRDLTSAKKPEKRPLDNGDKKDENTHLSILEKALSTVEDEDLRAKALKALAECGIGLERFVPLRPNNEYKRVKDSDTQTPVFGLWDPVEFIYVPKDTPGIHRKRPIERQPPQNVAHIVGNAHALDLTLNGMEMPFSYPPGETELGDWVENWVGNNDTVTLVQNILTKKNLNPVRTEVVEQLEEDFKTYNEYDEEGLLNIHKAVLADQPRLVLRHLKVLKACRESVDLPTLEGRTSLELAVHCDVSPKIVKMLLENGAQPTCEEAAHDSALIIASKKSLPILTDLIPYVTPAKSLDNYDSAGFAALHYCAQNGDEAGVKALLRASASVDLRDCRSGRTALFHAVENEHIDLALALLAGGAQPNISNYSGQTVANLVDDNKHYNLAETLSRLAK